MDQKRVGKTLEVIWNIFQIHLSVVRLVCWEINVPLQHKKSAIAGTGVIITT